MKKTTQFQNLSSLQKNLLAQLAHMMIVDSRRLSAKIKGLNNIRNAEEQQKVVDEIKIEIKLAQERLQQRKSAVEKIVFPENLPVSQRKEEILTAIANHQVVVIAGETGSGKTTQLPKMCLELGLGKKVLLDILNHDELLLVQ